MTSQQVCLGKTKKGEPCGKRALPNSKFCNYHQPMMGVIVEDVDGDGTLEHFCQYCNASISPQTTVCPHCKASLNKKVELDYYSPQPKPATSASATPQYIVHRRWIDVAEWWDDHKHTVFFLVWIVAMLTVDASYAITWHTYQDDVNLACAPYTECDRMSMSSLQNGLNATLNNLAFVVTPTIPNFLLEPDFRKIAQQMRETLDMIRFFYDANADAEKSMYFNQLLSQKIDGIDTSIDSMNHNDIPLSYFSMILLNIAIVCIVGLARDAIHG